MLPNNSNRYARQLRQVVSYPGCLLAENENMNEAGIQHRQFYASSLTILLCSKPSSKIVLVLSLTQHAAEEGGISLLPGHYPRGGRIGANCVDCEMVPVVTRAQYLHLNYVAGETEGGGKRGEGSSLVPRLSPPKESGNEAIARKETMEQLMGKAWK